MYAPFSYPALLTASLGFLTSFVPAFAIPVLRSPSQTTILNCTGDATPQAPSNYLPYFSTYGPQMNGVGGWDQWTITVPDRTYLSMAVFQWTRGDPASPLSNPDGLGTFSMFYAGTNYSTTVTDVFEVTQVGNTELHLAVGNNRLVFDGNSYNSYGQWNITVDLPDFQADLVAVFVIPGVPFTPSYKDEDGLVADGYYNRVHAARAHTDGTFTTPSQGSWVLQVVSTVKHSYGDRPIQTAVSSYTRGFTLVLYSTLNWLSALTTDNQAVKAAQLVIGSQVTSELELIYQATNKPSVLTIDGSGNDTTTVTFPGCSETENNPYVLATYPGGYFGTLVDSAGGKTDYYTTISNASLWIDGELYVDDALVDSVTILEVYTSPIACDA